MDLGAGANLRDFHRVAILPKHQQFSLTASSCPSNREGFHKDSLGGSGLSSFYLPTAIDWDTNGTFLCGGSIAPVGSERRYFFSVFLLDVSALLSFFSSFFPVDSLFALESPFDEPVLVPEDDFFA